MKSVVRVAVVQAESTWFDLDGGVKQVIAIMRQAAAQGAELVAFPEVFVPGYPWWIWLGTPAAGFAYVPRYMENCMTRDGAEMDEICAAAAEIGIHVVLGFAERAGGTLYLSQATIDDHGEILSIRRKLKPTHVERTVFGEGDGSDIRVVDSALGRLGALNCAEHIQPLTKYAMYAQGEELHVASWPSFSIYKGMAPALSAEVNTAASRVYALEGQAFVLAPCAFIGERAWEEFCPTEEQKKLMPLGGGAARLYGPDGAELCPPLDPTSEGLLVADLHAAQIAVAKHAYDPVGHYSRPDVFTLLFNATPNQAMIVSREDPAARAVAEPEDTPEELASSQLLT